MKTDLKQTDIGTRRDSADAGKLAKPKDQTAESRRMRAGSLAEVRAGVIGMGFIGPIHIEALRRLGIQVTAVCSRSLTPDCGRALGIARVFSDFRELVRCPEVEVIHITSPNRYHCEMSLAGLEAGKHVVCEKPLAMTTRETALLVKTARKAKKVFAVNYNVRFYPAVLQLRHLVQTGTLGEIIHVNGSYFQDWLLKDTDYNWRLLSVEGGRLRAVADIGTHWMDTVRFVLGSEIKQVLAELSTWHRVRRRPEGAVKTFSPTGTDIKFQPYQVDTDDFASVLLRFANGTRGAMSVSQVAAGRKNCIQIEIYGSRKSAWWCSENPEFLHLGNRDSANETAIRAAAGFGDGARGFTDYPAGHLEGFADTFKMSFRAIYSAIVGGQASPPLFATAEDGHREVALCEAIERSHKQERWITV